MQRRISLKTDLTHATSKLLRAIANAISTIGPSIRKEWLARRREQVLSGLNAHLQQDVGHSSDMARRSAEEHALNLQLLRNP